MVRSAPDGLETRYSTVLTPSRPPRAQLSQELNADMSPVRSWNPSDYDPDISIPSVESQDLPKPLIDSDSSLASSPGGCLSTTNVDRTSLLTPQPSEDDSVQDQTILLQESKLQTPDRTGELPRRTESTPSIQVLPAATVLQTTSEDDSLTRSMETLKILDRELNPQKHLGSRGTSSPSPSRRRRSGSAIVREIHRVGDEEPLNDNWPVLQKSFATALSCVSNTARVLSSSGLHLEPDSTTHKLYHEASAMAQFQLPSSRIVGFIGDSGVGKSSLINSLLDKPDLARTVSIFYRSESLPELT